MLIRPPVNTPDRLEIKLLKAAAPICREYGNMTVNDARRRLARFHFLVPCVGRVNFFKTMRVRQVTLFQYVDRPQVPQTCVFQCAFDVFRARFVRNLSALGPLLEHVARAEVEARASAGNWELIEVPDEELSRLARALQDASAWFNGNDGFSLQLLRAAVSLEQQARFSESTHQRMKRLAASQEFASENAAIRNEERRNATAWLDERKVRGSNVHLPSVFGFLEEIDQLVLAYRDRTRPIDGTRLRAAPDRPSR